MHTRKWSEALCRGSGNPVFDTQHTFRKLLYAMSYPGRIVTVESELEAPNGISIAAAAICLTLLDYETPLWSDLPTTSEAVEWVRFHCGCPMTTDPFGGSLALVTRPWKLHSLRDFRLGTDYCPEDSATLIFQVVEMGTNKGMRLNGPGIYGTTYFEVKDFPKHLWAERKQLEELYPRGLDFIFCCERAVVAIPRTTRIGG